MAERKPYPSESADKFLLRLPDGMRERIAREAKLNKRTMNAEIITRLEESFSVELDPGADIHVQLNAESTEAFTKAVRKLDQLVSALKGQIKEGLLDFDPEPEQAPKLPKKRKRLPPETFED
jgi:hypothetical protein